MRNTRNYGFSLVRVKATAERVVKSAAPSAFMFALAALSVLLFGDSAFAQTTPPAEDGTAAITTFVTSGKTQLLAVIAVIATAVLGIMLTGTGYSKGMAWLKKTFKSA